ncbi:hypothetical protein DITRI_Ditri10aG0096700 [Diplodiscus trichospermus]
MVERSLCMREARGSIPRISTPFYFFNVKIVFDGAVFCLLLKKCVLAFASQLHDFLKHLSRWAAHINQKTLSQLPSPAATLCLQTPSDQVRAFVVKSSRIDWTRPGSNPFCSLRCKRLSRVGFWIAKELSRGRYTCMSRTRQRQIPCGQYQLSVLELLPETRAFQEAIFQKHHDFSTSTSNNASEGGDGQKETISVTYVSKDGEEIPIQVPIGMSMLEAAHENDIELEGACEGSLACSTCHVIVMDMEYYNKLEDPTDEENDMLDLAFGLTETSRLGCQIIASPELDGIRLAIPAATRNFAVDGSPQHQSSRSCESVVLDKW